MDPGITTGVAVLDSNGNVLDIHSKRDMTRAEVITCILKFGNPVIISSDVSTTPKSVEKVATKLGCITYSPDISLSTNEKRELTKEYYNSVKNDHEIDALSAAIKAWKQYRVLFSKIESVLKRFNRQDILADVVLKILKMGSPNIEDTVREFIEKERLPIMTESPSKKESMQMDLINNLQKKIGEKQKEIDSLKNQNALISKALNEVRKMKSKENNLKIVDSDNNLKLRDSIAYLKKLRKLENKNYCPIIEFPKMDGYSIEETNNEIDLENRVVLTSTNENLNMLNDKNIKCLLVLDKSDLKFENLEFPIIQVEKYMIETFDGIKAIKADYIEKRLTDAKRSGLIGWLEDYRKRKG